MNVLVSACLLGVRCRYRGDSKPCPAVLALREKYCLIPVCPEQLGGLPTPRTPAELRGGLAVTSDGEDRTEPFARGARETLRLAELFGCRAAVLKSLSPSCGFGLIHDGSFSGALVPGNGVAAELLHRAGIPVLNEENAAEGLAALERDAAGNFPPFLARTGFSGYNNPEGVGQTPPRKK